ncbi:MAG: hypothetical protein EHM18_03395 [Acidobacteria bacterium]|nr:MAG: hypothetical protein EHM18_03395 [Acidobacteriota bacterium]
MGAQELTLHVYRDLSNRLAGEPDDGPSAWLAHRERLRVLREVLEDRAFQVSDWGGADDEKRTHELAEFVVQIIHDPTVQAAMLGAAVYAGKVIAKQVDNLAGHAVEKILDRLISGFKRKKIGDFWISFPDGSRIQLSPNSDVSISIRGGKPIEYHVDSPPVQDSADASSN